MIRKFLTFIIIITLSVSAKAQTSFSLEKRAPIDSVLYDSLKSVYPGMANVKFYDFTYKSNGSNVTGYLLTPAREGKFPVIIYNIGGNVGIYHFSHDLAAKKIGFLAESGFAVIVSNYCDQNNPQNVDEFGGKDLDNIVNLAQHLFAFSELDTSRIGMYGWSRGGMESYMLLRKLPNIKAMAVGGALTDVEDMFQKRAEMDSVLGSRIPNYKANRKAEMEKRSAIKWVDKLPATTPILIVHGSADWRVDVLQALAMGEALYKNHIPYRLIIFEGSEHGISEHLVDVKMQVSMWFKRYLVKGEKLPDLKLHGD